MRTINKIIYHCTDTPNFKRCTVDTIRGWHMKRGFEDIGYHYIIYPSGAIMSGRPVRLAGAHCKGQNKDSIGVALVGRDDFNSEQIASANKIKNILENIFGELEVFGHRDFNKNKSCPGFDVKSTIK